MREILPGRCLTVRRIFFFFLLLFTILLFYHLPESEAPMMQSSNALSSSFDAISDRKEAFLDVISSAQDATTKAPNKRAFVVQYRPQTVLADTSQEVDLDQLVAYVDAEKPEEKLVGYQKYQFNAALSDEIGENRRIPDARNSRCPSTFPSRLPRAAIVICYFNESPTVLLRMVTSILARTPFDLIEEILLVDDSSTFPEATESVLAAMSRPEWSKVRLIKTAKNEGLIRAKIFGAKQANGEVLVFLDSHCEVNKNWLEPLLQRIHEDRKRVVCPLIDIIDSDSLKYVGSPLCYGGFDWSLTFKWDYPTRSFLENVTNLIIPLESATMAGGLFAIEKDYFFEIGAYDEGMDVWGAENVEISFRIWMCGGRLEVIPCSRVGHIFRRRRPYGLSRDTMGRNSLRAAAVWLDEYFPKFIQSRPHLAMVDHGDISARVAIKEKLQCKPFRWYLRNIYPILLPGNIPDKADYMDNLVANDRKYHLRHNNSSLCVWVDSSGTHVMSGSELVLRSCSNHRLSTWKWSVQLELRPMGSSTLCLDSLRALSVARCHLQGVSQEWHYTKQGKIFNGSSGKCLHFPMGHNAPGRMEYCTLSDSFSIFNAVNGF